MKRKISNGDRFGSFVVTEAYVSLGGKRHWYHKCQCDCGYEEILNGSSLQKRILIPCNHGNRIKPGDRFGRLVVVKELPSIIGKSRIKYECICDCGNIKQVAGTYLKKGYVKSCGCLQKDTRSQSHMVHGMEGTRLYRIWRNIKNRCMNPKSTQYRWYGGRGINICEEWMSFEPFMKWAFENGYKNNLTIDRKNNECDYYPENCHWITASENTRKQKSDREALRARLLVSQISSERSERAHA
ncbi:MAG: hypothetical protein SAMD01599839_08220 [Rectinema sp.]